MQGENPHIATLTHSKKGVTGVTGVTTLIYKDNFCVTRVCTGVTGDTFIVQTRKKRKKLAREGSFLPA